VLMQALNRDLITAAFYLNQRYIAANLCENTGRPDLHCNGTCQLKKALKKAAEKEERASTNHHKTEVQICQYWAEFRLSACVSACIVYQYPTDDLFAPLGKPNDIFKPPIGC